MTTSDTPTVLAVDDDEKLLETYRMWLDADYDLRLAGGGEEALEQLDDDVQVVLLDRLMPGLSGDEVLERIRESGHDCRVAMVTAVEPDTDIVDMAFDDYLVKPVSEEELVRMVENLRIRDAYSDGVKRLFSLASKKALLESEKDPNALDANSEYRQLCADLTDLRTQLDDKLARLSESDDLTLIYQDLERDDAARDE